MTRFNIPCYSCGSMDACSHYTNSGEIPAFHCHKCGWHVLEHNKEYKDWYEEIILDTSKKYIYTAKVEQQAPPPRNVVSFPREGIIKALSDRGLTLQTAQKFQVETLFNPEGQPIGRAFPGYSATGEFVGQKCKPIDKTESKIVWAGSHAESRLFGQKHTQAGGKFITITEGEEDCMAVYQMLKEDNPSFEPAVVSIKDGASSAERDLKASYEFINSFQQVILCFDGDEVGKKAVLSCAQLFPGKSKIIQFKEYKEDKDGKHWKDANEYLLAGRNKDFIHMWWKAEKYSPDGVIPFHNLWDAMVKSDEYLLIPFPWEGLNKKLYGMMTSKMLVWKAFPKIGKTSVLKELIYQIHSTTKHNVGIIFLEDTLKSIGLGFCALQMNKPITRPDAVYSMDDLKKAHELLSENDRLTIFDPSDERTVENIFKKIMFFVKANDCKFIFLDHASMLAYSSGDGDERKFLDKLFSDLASLVVQLNIHLSVVIHVNDDGKTRGSRAPVQLCDGLISLQRDKLNEDEIVKNTTEVIVEENRLSGDSGLACKLFYDRETGRMTELDLAVPTVNKINEELFDK